jgi:hypothetical protein
MCSILLCKNNAICWKVCIYVFFLKLQQIAGIFVLSRGERVYSPKKWTIHTRERYNEEKRKNHSQLGLRPSSFTLFLSLDPRRVHLGTWRQQDTNLQEFF